MNGARIYLRIAGALTLVFGLLYLWVPATLTDPAGFGDIGPGGVTDIRATYGGFQLGLGAFLLWAASSPQLLRPALVLMALSIGAVGLSRFLGLVLDGSLNSFHMGGLATEISLTVLTLFFWRRAANAPER